MQSLQGQLLVASPHLRDPNFLHSVVLIVQHDVEGALGLVLNRPSDRSINEVWQELTGRQSDNPSPIYVGGPLAGPLMAVHTNGRFPENEIVPGLWFATHRDQLHEIVEEPGKPFRLFNGYSGWGEGQLDGEMEAGGWLTMRAHAKFVFPKDDETLWQVVAHEIGDDILRTDRRIREIPDDPSMN